jgi:hypothetical protein
MEEPIIRSEELDGWDADPVPSEEVQDLLSRLEGSTPKHRARQEKTKRLQKFLRGFFPKHVLQGEVTVNGHLLVLWRSNTGERVEIYELPLHNPHGRFSSPPRSGKEAESKWTCECGRECWQSHLWCLNCHRDRPSSPQSTKQEIE